MIRHNLGHYCVPKLGLASAYILKQSVMFQTCLLSAKKQRLELAYRHCERDKKILPRDCEVLLNAEQSVYIYYFI